MDQEIDVQIDEQDLTDVNDYTEEELADGEKDWKAEALAAKGIAKRRTTALRKAKENFGKTTKAPENKPNQAPEKGTIGYGEKAYLNSLGFTDAEDHKFVESAMKESGRSLEEVLASPFMKGELSRMKEERTTKAAAPSADNRQGLPTRDSVDYWLKKGELPPPDQAELRQKVVNAKIAKSKGGNNFSQTPVVGNA